jgi:two-component system, response regulator PdtaR
MTALSIHGQVASIGPATAPCVLVVEDEVIVRMLIAEALREAGCSVIEAASADEAVRVLKATAAPDVLITDVKLPGAIDGFELAASIRRAQPRMKVIVTSGHASPDTARHVADAFLAKPFELQQLVGQVRTLAGDL